MDEFDQLYESIISEQVITGIDNNLINSLFGIFATAGIGVLGIRFLLKGVPALIINVLIRKHFKEELKNKIDWENVINKLNNLKKEYGGFPKILDGIEDRINHLAKKDGKIVSFRPEDD